MNDAQDMTGSKTRIALMGEFSAGKSTVANLLLGRAASPVQVTATQLPPVWYRFGTEQASRVDAETGAEDAMPTGDWSLATPQTTERINVQMEVDFLKRCDLIDMPGTSDPNMAPDLWERTLPDVDVVLWCTPAAQAWRQSEAALWDMLPPKLWENSLLLITRMDKLQTDRDRARVLLRVRRETEGLFHDVLPMSLLAALNASHGSEERRSSGVDTLFQRIVDVFERMGVHDIRPAQTQVISPAAPAEGPIDSPKIIPRRVVRQSNASPRPRPEVRTH